MPAWVGFGTAAAVTTQVQAAYPSSGIVAKNKLYYCIGTNSTITTAPAAPSGWSLVGAMVSTGTMKVLMYEKTNVDGTETGNGPLITGFTSGTVGAASIVCIGPTTAGNELVTNDYSTGVDSTSGTAFSATGSSMTTTTADLILGFLNAIATTGSFAATATATLAQAGATISQTSRFIGRTGTNTVNYNCNTASITTGGTGAASMTETLNVAGTGSALFIRVTEITPTAKSGTDSATVTDTATGVQQGLSASDSDTLTDSTPSSVATGALVDAGTVSDSSTSADATVSATESGAFTDAPGSNVIADTKSATDSATQSDPTPSIITSSGVSASDSATQSDPTPSQSATYTSGEAFGLTDDSSVSTGPPVDPSPAYRASVSAQGTSTTTSFTITIPGTVVDGDFGIIIGAAGSGSNASDPPSGWATIKSDVQIGTGRYAIYGKQYVAGDANPVLNYPTAPASGNNISYLAVWWQDCGGVDVVGSNLTNPAAQLTNTASGLTSARDKDLFVAIGWQKGSGSGFASAVPTVSPDVTVRASRIATGNFYSSLAVADFVIDPAGTVGDQTFTWNFSTINGAGFSLLLKNNTVAPPVSKSASDSNTFTEAELGALTVSSVETQTFTDVSAAPAAGNFPIASDSMTQSDSTPSFFGSVVSATDQVGFADVATTPGPPPGGAPFYRATAKATGGSTVTSHIVVRPGTVQVGDWQYILVNAGNGSGATTTPTGFDVVVPSQQISGMRIAVYARQYQAGDSANVTITWPSAPTSGNNTGYLSVWVANSEGYDVVGALTNNVVASDITTAVGLTTAEAGALILAWSAMKGTSTGFPSSVAWSPDATVIDTLVAASTFNVGISVASFLQATQGLTPDQIADWDFSTTNATAFQISMNPIGAGLGVKAANDTFTATDDGTLSGASVFSASDTLDSDDRHISRFIVDTTPDMTFAEAVSAYVGTGTASDTSAFSDISQQTTLVFANDSWSVTDQPGVVGGGVTFLSSSDGSTFAESVAATVTLSRPDPSTFTDVASTNFNVQITVSDALTITEQPYAIFVPRAAFDALGVSENSFKFIVGNSNFTLWNGTVELPLDLLGQWNGVTLVPILFEGTV